MSNLTIGEQLQHVTCIIKTDTGSGTGFVYNISNIKNLNIPMLVTNRHVVERCKHSFFYMTVKKINGQPDFGNEVHFEVPIDQWLMHPDSEIDLAMTPIATLLENAKTSGKNPFYISLTADLIADDSYLKNMDAIENILMIGYPTGVFDKTNNLPVARRGITASRIGLRYNGRPEFLIDCACFPGSSGSPVFQFDTGPKLNRNGDISLGEVRFKFLGVLWGGPVHNLDGEIVAVPIETSVKPVSRTSMMTNLGYCVRASELAGFEMMLSKEIEALKI